MLLKTQTLPTSLGLRGYIQKTSDIIFTEIFYEASKGNEIKVVKDQYGTPTNTEKVADFIIKIIISLPRKGIYHCAGREVKTGHGMTSQRK